MATSGVDLNEARAALAQPVPSVRVPFLADGEIDWRGLSAYVERCMTAGSAAIMLTYGDSLYSVLTDDEVAEVTRVVAAQVAGRALVIAADRSWWTGKTVVFARFCREAGADVIMVLPPDWTQSSTPDTLTRHYAAVAEEMPVMLVSTYMRTREMATSLAIIDQVYRDVPGVVGIKEDVGGEFGRQMTAMVAQRWAVVAGGSKRLHADLTPYGCQGYLSTLAVFHPELTRDYWQAVRASDSAKVERIVRDVDVPMFDMLKQSAGGFDAAMHGWAELVGIYGRWRRSPYHSLADGELNGLADRLSALGLLVR